MRLSCNSSTLALVATLLTLAVDVQAAGAATRTLPRTVSTWADLADEDIRGFWKSIIVLEDGGVAVAKTLTEVTNSSPWAVSADYDKLARTDASGGGKWIRQFDGDVNVKWTGATGDGATDDTAALLAAMEIAESKGCGIYIPASSTAYVASSFTSHALTGDLKMVGDSAELSVIAGPAGTGSSDFISLGAYSLDISDIGITGFEDLITLDDSSSPDHLRLANCHFTDFERGVVGGDVDDASYIETITVTGCTFEPLDTVGASALWLDKRWLSLGIYDCTFIGGTQGVNIGESDADVVTDPGQYYGASIVSGCKFTGFATGLNAWDYRQLILFAHGVVVDGCSFTDSGANTNGSYQATTDDAIYSQSAGALIVGCEFRNQQTDVIVTLKGGNIASPTTNAVGSGQTVRDCSFINDPTVQTDTSAIYVTREWSKIEGCLFYGISGKDSDHDDAVLHGHTLSNNDDAAIIVSHNTFANSVGAYYIWSEDTTHTEVSYGFKFVDNYCDVTGMDVGARAVSPPRSNNMTISGNTFIDTASANNVDAIIGSNTVTGNWRICNNTAVGLQSFVRHQAGAWANTIITGNIINDVTYPIWLVGGSWTDCIISDNIISGVVYDQTQDLNTRAISADAWLLWLTNERDQVVTAADSTHGLYLSTTNATVGTTWHIVNQDVGDTLPVWDVSTNLIFRLPPSSWADFTWNDGGNAFLLSANGFLGVSVPGAITISALSGTTTLTNGVHAATQVASSAASTPVFALSDSGATEGAQFRIVNQDGAATLDVNANGSTPLKTIATSSWGLFQWDQTTTDWVLIGYGSL